MTMQELAYEEALMLREEGPNSLFMRELRNGAERFVGLDSDPDAEDGDLRHSDDWRSHTVVVKPRMSLRLRDLGSIYED